MTATVVEKTVVTVLNWGLKWLNKRGKMRSFELASPTLAAKRKAVRYLGDHLDTQRVADAHRYEEKNNGYATRASQVLPDYVVGCGIKPFVDDDDDPNLDRIIKTFLVNQPDRLADCDSEGMTDILGLQWRFFHSVVTEGDGLILRRRRRRATKSGMTFDLRLLSAKQLDRAKTGTHRNNEIFQGVEVNRAGKPVAYWLYEQDPDLPSREMFVKSKRIPANDVIHGFMPFRPNHKRGVSWGHSADTHLLDLRAYERAVMGAQKIAACLSVFYEGDDIQPSESEQMSRLKPGSLMKLPSTQHLKIVNPPQSPNHSVFRESQLRAAASGWNMPYEALSGDYSNVNYSSARLRWMDWSKSLDRIRLFIIQGQMLPKLSQWIYESMDFMGTPRTGRLNYAVPPREYMDPKTEVPADIAKVRGGFKTMPQMLRERGIEPVKQAEAIAKWNDLMDALGVDLDTDPRKKDMAGQTQREEKSDA